MRVRYLFSRRWDSGSIACPDAYWGQSRSSINPFSRREIVGFAFVNRQFIALDGGGTRLIKNQKYALGVIGYFPVYVEDYKGNEMSMIEVKQILTS